MKIALISILSALTFLSLTPGTQTAEAGQMIYENMYSDYTLVQGEGKTVEQARKDALASLPKGWVLDDENSPTIECTKTDAVLADGTKCDGKIADNKLRITIPVIEAEAEVATKAGNASGKL